MSIGALTMLSISWAIKSPLHFVTLAVPVCLAAFLLQRIQGPGGRIWKYLAIYLALIITLMVIKPLSAAEADEWYLGLVAVAGVGLFIIWWLRLMWLGRRKREPAAVDQGGEECG